MIVSKASVEEACDALTDPEKALLRRATQHWRPGGVSLLPWPHKTVISNRTILHRMHKKGVVTEPKATRSRALRDLHGACSAQISSLGQLVIARLARQERK